jgi:hypothetical protein
MYFVEIHEKNYDRGANKSLIIHKTYTGADLEGACGVCAPLKFAKHMLYNVN